MSTRQSHLVAGRFRLLAPLGEGGMGRVWRARDEVLHRQVAIKELVAPPGLTPEERAELQARSMREARAVARLDHPNVVRIFDVIEVNDGDPCIVMEYLPGQSLQQAMADGPLPVPQVARIGLGILQALAAAHELGVVHRDVKPGNILLTTNGRAVLTDFGIAAVPGDPFVTRTGMLLGSPAYLAPERARPGTTTAASDLWSLGATLYAATEGKPPFARATTIETLTALSTEPVPAPERSGPLTPALLGLLQKDPTERIDNATAQRLLREAPDTPATLALSTEQIPIPEPRLPEPAPAEPAQAEPAQAEPAQSEPAQSEPAQSEPALAEPAPSTSPPRRRRRALAVLAGVAALALLAALSVTLTNRPEDTPEAPPVGDQEADDQPAGDSPADDDPADDQEADEPTTESGTAAGETTTTPAGFELPDGWQMRDDGTGFEVPVPEGWQSGRDQDGRALWQDPATGRLLLIDQTREPRPDPVQDWENNEQARRDGYADYQRIRLEAVSYWDDAADWEFTYTHNGTPVRVLNRGFVTASDQAYSIYWRTPADAWEEHRDDLQIVLDGFVPART